jgi:hypothetical protein
MAVKGAVRRSATTMVPIILTTDREVSNFRETHQFGYPVRRPAAATT